MAADVIHFDSLSLKLTDERVPTSYTISCSVCVRVIIRMLTLDVQWVLTSGFLSPPLNFIFMLTYLDTLIPKRRTHLFGGGGHRFDSFSTCFDLLTVGGKCLLYWHVEMTLFVQILCQIHENCCRLALGLTIAMAVILKSCDDKPRNYNCLTES